jgi:CrcB protein
MQRMRTVLAVALAGALGALARWGIGSWFGHRLSWFPWGTLVINVSGSFVLGVLFAVLVERNAGSPTMRVALMTGLLGAYTTFSTFSLETFRLFEEGATGRRSRTSASACAWGCSACGSASRPGGPSLKNPSSRAAGTSTSSRRRRASQRR